jgi:hypothetical protein
MKDILRLAKQLLARTFVRFLKTKEARQWVIREFPDYEEIRNELVNIQNPYHSRHAVSQATEKPVFFVTGRYRSGSTLLWNIFRKLEGHTAYYEPFNERRWFDSSFRGTRVDSTHQGVQDYWSEYSGLEHLGRYYDEDWTRQELFMGPDVYAPKMKAYIDELISAAEGTAVLQFNRIDFRLPWIMKNFPNAKILHIHRNPRDQWCSVLGDFHSYPSSARTREGFQDRFYHCSWVRDLSRQFPFLEDYATSHQYYTFYFLWKLSFVFGSRFADLSIAMERLTENPKDSFSKIITATGSNLNFEDLDLSFVNRASSRWQDYASDKWFTTIESECERVLDDFFYGEMREM